MPFPRVPVVQGVQDAPAGSVTAVLVSVAALVSALVPLTAAQSAAAASIATAIGTIVAAWRARSADLAVLTGAAGIVLENLAVFGLHLTPGQDSAVIAAVAVVLGALMHLTGADSPARKPPAPVPPAPVPPAPVVPPGGSP